MTSTAIEEIEHTADVSIRVRGSDLEALFVNAALGMATLMTDVKEIEPNIQRQLSLEEFDVETLMVSWLSELLWFNEESGAVFVRFEITRLTPTHLEATVWGGPAASQWKHIKAVTFHDLDIKLSEQGYEVTVVFDV